MIRDAADLQDGAVIDADLCIVGGGPAGITIAEELRSSGLDVVLLESGGFELESATQDLARGELSGRPFGASEAPLDAVRLRLLGGTSMHWAGYSRPLESFLFDRRRPYVSVSDWPIDRAELEPWWDRASELQQLIGVESDWRWWDEQADAGAARIESERWITLTYQIRGTRFGTTYRESLERAPTTTVYLHANAVELVTDDADRRVVSVTVKTLGGDQHEVRPRAVVIACGGIETARLLLASNSRRPAGLGNEHDLVGRYFNEHVQVLGGLAAVEGSVERWRQLNEVQVPASSGLDQGVRTKGVVVPTESFTLEREMLGFEAQAIAAPAAEGPVHTAGLSTADTAGLLAASGVDAETVLWFQAIGEQDPDPESRVTLTRDTDPLGMPRVDVHWKVADRDQENLRRGVRALGVEIARLGLGRLQVALGDLEPITDPERAEQAVGLLDRYEITPDPDDDELPVFHGNHHMGTTRMAAAARDGVVDPDCRVHSVDNLYVASSSIFPVSGAAPPTFNLIALAARLADHLTSQVLR